jgi:hypothetical protein
MKKAFVLMSMCLLFASAANATIIEVGNNNAIGSANPIALGASMPWSDVGIMTLDSGTDVDFFSIYLNAGQILNVSTTPMGVKILPGGVIFFETPDTYMGVFDTANALKVSDDNSFSTNSYGSLVQYQATQAGYYSIAVTGAGDTDFDGKVNPGNTIGHNKTGSYMLTVSVIPEPATLAFMSLIGLGMLARRRK